MSFSSDVKEELLEINTSASHCRIAELAAMLCMDGQITLTEDDCRVISLQTEYLAVAKRYYGLLKKGFQIQPEISVRRSSALPNNGIYSLTILRQEDIERVLDQACMVSAREEDSWIPDRGIFYLECCRKAFLRGAFLASGSMSNPERGYHFEITCTTEEKAEMIQELMASFGIEAKQILRKKYFVVYVKESEQIVDLLGVMSAYRALMELENIRILKGMRENINRQVNCETANISKASNAAGKQIEDILLIRDKLGLHTLPEPLREIAEARLKEPEISLKELGDYLDPPVGKSGVNHRLRKIRSIADELRGGPED